MMASDERFKVKFRPTGVWVAGLHFTDGYPDGHTITPVSIDGHASPAVFSGEGMRIFWEGQDGFEIVEIPGVPLALALLDRVARELRSIRDFDGDRYDPGDPIGIIAHIRGTAGRLLRELEGKP